MKDSCKLLLKDSFDKNEIHSGWLLWCHSYVLGYLLKTKSGTLEVIIDFESKT